MYHKYIYILIYLTILIYTTDSIEAGEASVQVPRLLLLLHRPLLLPQDAPVPHLLGLPEGAVLEGAADAPQRDGLQAGPVQGGEQAQPQLPPEVAPFLQCGQEKRYLFYFILKYNILTKFIRVFVDLNVCM